MSHIFYFLSALFAIYELAKMFNCRALYAERRKLFRMNKQDRSLYLDYSPVLNWVENIDLVQYIFLIVGLFSSQWFAYIFIIGLSLSRFQRLGAWATCLDSLLTALIFIFAIINKYQWL